MAIEAAETETLIKETAKNLFFRKGLLSATTQEIADEAGVNRALIHYYFRSREQLLETVLDEALDETRAKIHAIFDSEDPFKEKISKYLDVFIDRNMEYPYIQNFIITELTRNAEKMKEHSSRKRNFMMKKIIPELEREIKKGNVPDTQPEHFIVNLMSMCSYPLIAKPFLQNIFSLDEKAYKSFIKERKKIIYKTLFQEDFIEK